MNEVAKGPLRFTGIETANWRNFGQATVRLQNRVFLVGPNASGKSNFLDIFRFLREIASVGGGFQAAVQNRGGVSSLRSLSARRYPDISLVATIGTGTGPDSWEYGLSFTQDSRRRPFIQHEHVARGGEELWSRPSEEDLRDRERLTQTYIEQVSLNREFRELVEFLASVRYLHLVPQLVRDPDRSAGRKGDPYGGDFLEQLARTQERIRIARLRRIREALRVAVPQLSELDLFRDERGIPHLRGKYLNWRREGAWQTEERFSDGTLRLLGLLWSIQDGNG